MDKAEEYDKHECKVYKIDFKEKKLIGIDMMESSLIKLPSEAIAFLKAFNAGELVQISFIVNSPHNKLPPVFNSQSLGVTKWSKKYDIPDFGYDSTGIFGSLSFTGKMSFVLITWASVFQISVNHASLASWPEKLLEGSK